MKVKTADLIGPALDWAVAKCEGFSIEFESENGGRFWITRTNHAQQYFPPFGYLDETFFPSSDWSQGGPIIQKEITGLDLVSDWKGTQKWSARKFEYLSDNHTRCVEKIGPTPLVAAMRCFVASRFGDEIEIPEELLK